MVLLPLIATLLAVVPLTIVLSALAIRMVVGGHRVEVSSVLMTLLRTFVGVLWNTWGLLRMCVPGNSEPATRRFLLSARYSFESDSLYERSLSVIDALFQIRNHLNPGGARSLDSMLTCFEDALTLKRYPVRRSPDFMNTVDRLAALPLVDAVSCAERLWWPTSPRSECPKTLQYERKAATLDMPGSPVLDKDMLDCAEGLGMTREAVAEIESRYGDFNRVPLSTARLIQICRNEGIDCQAIDGFCFLSGLFPLGGSGGGAKAYLFWKASAHPTLRHFVIGHELGHWFLHLQNRRNETVPDCARNLSCEKLEYQAHAFSLMTVFPTQRMERLLSSGELTLDKMWTVLKDHFADPEYDFSSISSALACEWRNFFKLRMEVFLHQHARRVWFEGRGHLSKEESERWFPDRFDGLAWGILDHRNNLVATNQLFADLMNRPVSELVGLPLRSFVLNDAEYNRALSSLTRKRSTLSVAHHFQRSPRKGGGALLVSVVAIPILSHPNGQYLGSAAIVIPHGESDPRSEPIGVQPNLPQPDPHKDPHALSPCGSLSGPPSEVPFGASLS